MPKIKDNRILEGKINRNNAIIQYFNKRFSEGLRYEIVENEIILKFGVSPSLINRIMKNG